MIDDKFSNNQYHILDDNKMNLHPQPASHIQAHNNFNNIHNNSDNKSFINRTNDILVNTTNINTIINSTNNNNNIDNDSFESIVAKFSDDEEDEPAKVNKQNNEDMSDDDDIPLSKVKIFCSNSNYLSLII